MSRLGTRGRKMPRERKERGGKEGWKTRGKRGFTGCVVRDHGDYCMNSQPRFSDLFSYIKLVEHGLIIPAVGYRRCIQSEHAMSSRDSKEILGSPQAIAEAQDYQRQTTNKKARPGLQSARLHTSWQSIPHETQDDTFITLSFVQLNARRRGPKFQ